MRTVGGRRRMPARGARAGECGRRPPPSSSSAGRLAAAPCGGSCAYLLAFSLTGSHAGPAAAGGGAGRDLHLQQLGQRLRLRLLGEQPANGSGRRQLFQPRVQHRQRRQRSTKSQSMSAAALQPCARQLTATLAAPAAACLPCSPAPTSPSAWLSAASSTTMQTKWRSSSVSVCF